MPHQIRSDDLLALARPNPPNRDAALLRATTTLFCQDASHDRDSVRRYEQLATYFLPRAPVADRVFVAELLADQKDAPEAVIRLLARDDIEVAAPVLRRSQVLGHIDLLGVIGATGPDHHRLIAARDHLHPDVVKALSIAGVASTAAPEATSDAPASARAVARAMPAGGGPQPAPSPTAASDDRPTSPLRTAPHPLAPTPMASPARPDAGMVPVPPVGLAANGRKLPPLPAKPPFARAALRESAARQHPLASPAGAPETGSPALARALPTSPPAVSRPPTPRQDDDDADERKEGLAALAVAGFLKLEPAARLRLIADIAARRARAHHHAVPHQLDEAVHLAFNRTRILVSARRGDRQGLIAAFAAVTGIAEPLIERLVEDPSGEALVMLVRGAGLSEIDGRTVLLLANPAIGQSVETFSRLADLLAGMESGVAEGFLSAWREKPARRPIHQPAEIDSAGVRARNAAGRAATPAPAHGQRPDRQTG